MPAACSLDLGFCLACACLALQRRQDAPDSEGLCSLKARCAMPNWLCRWRKGDVTLLNASDEADACVLLDEFDNADQAELHEIGSLMVDLRLNDRGDLELRDLGEQTELEATDLAFPELMEEIHSSGLLELDPESEEYRAKVRPLVEIERTRGFRQPPKKSKEPAAQVGRAIQQVIQAATATVDRWVEVAAEKILEETDDQVIR